MQDIQLASLRRLTLAPQVHPELVAWARAMSTVETVPTAVRRSRLQARSTCLAASRRRAQGLAARHQPAGVPVRARRPEGPPAER